MYEDTQWLSQNIFTHRDGEYGTNGYIRVSISTQTKDSETFSAPTFVINIQNDGVNKTVSLSYQKLFEIYDRLQSVVKEAIKEYSTKEGSPDAQLHYKTGKSTFITFEFLRGNQNEPVVRITISHGTSNSTKIIMPFSPEFHSFISLIGDMVGNRKYLDWCLHFPNRYYFNEMNTVLKEMPGLVRGAVAQIDNLTSEVSPPSNPNDSSPPIEEGSPVTESNASEAQSMMKELDAFVGDGMKNINLEIPFKEKEEEVKTEAIDNKFIKCFNGDMKNFENVVMRCSQKINPIRQLEKEFNENYAEMDCFPNIPENELKSMLYLIAREYFVYNKSVNEGSIKRSFSINRYSGAEHAKPVNLELAYDLLVAVLFFKICRDKIENKTADNYLNKTILHVSLSLNVAPFIFSFITEDTELESIVRDRFRLMDKSGMFDSYKNDEFKTYGFEIVERDMSVAVEDLRTGYFLNKSSGLDSYMRHVSLYNGQSCILNYDNPFNEEQIVNQVVPFEMYVITNNKSLDGDRRDLLDFATNEKIDIEVAEIFIKSIPKKNIPIVKFFEDHITEIPENNRLNFMKDLETFNERDYDLSDKKFPYDTFGEEGVKALFLWKPESGEKFNTYKKFYRAIVSSVHDKQTILSMIAQDNVDKSGESFADFYSNAIGKEK